MTTFRRSYAFTRVAALLVVYASRDSGAEHLVDTAIQAIITASRTGEIGDGRVFVMPAEEGYNIRTGERDST